MAEAETFGQIEEKTADTTPTTRSRRSMLKLGLRSLAAIGLGAVIGKESVPTATHAQATHNQEPDPELDTYFAAQIEGLKDNFGIDYAPDPTQGADWNSFRVILLASFLANVPPALYRDSPDGLKLRIEMTHASQDPQDCVKQGGTKVIKIDGSPLNYSMYAGFPGNDSKRPDLIAKNSAHAMLVESIVHAANPAPFSNEDGRKDYSGSAWNKDIEVILGGEFSSVQEELDKAIDARFPDLIFPLNEARSMYQNRTRIPGQRSVYDQPTQLRVDFLKSYIRGLWKVNDPSEFIAILSAQYYQGSKYFRTMYKSVLPEETVDRLYDFTKNTVFQGKEYTETLQDENVESLSDVELIKAVHADLAKRNILVEERANRGDRVLTAGRLLMLRDFANNLPPFIFSGEDGNITRPFRIVIDGTIDSTAGVGGQSLGRSELSLNSGAFSDSDRKLAAKILGHELTHCIGPTETRTVNGKEETVHPWHQKVIDIMGGKYWGTQGLELRQQVEVILTERHLPKDQRDFLQDFIYGADPTPTYQRLYHQDRLDPEEFIANLGGAYVRGPAYFHEMYGLVLPQDIIQKLYQFVKNEIFRGQPKDGYTTPLEESHAPVLSLPHG